MAEGIKRLASCQLVITQASKWVEAQFGEISWHGTLLDASSRAQAVDLRANFTISKMPV